MKFAHIINPVKVGPESDLFTAQPITYQSIRDSKEFAGKKFRIELYSTQYPEDADFVPKGFTRTADLELSVLDYGKFRKPRKLPLIRDILSRMVETRPDADFYIYSNVDIGLMPHFYLSIGSLIKTGVDAIAINRKTLPPHFNEVGQLPDIYSEIGMPHEGVDCFVFPASHLASYDFGNAVIGTGPVGLAFVANMLTYASKFRWLENKDLTFHIGDDKAWAVRDLNDYEAYNFNELMKVAQNLLQDLDEIDDRAKYEFLRSVEELCRVNLTGAAASLHPKQLLREISAIQDYSQSALAAAQAKIPGARRRRYWNKRWVGKLLRR